MQYTLDDTSVVFLIQLLNKRYLHTSDLAEIRQIEAAFKNLGYKLTEIREEL